MNDREQWYSYITHFSEQAMQGGLIDYRTGEKGLAIVFQCDGQTLKPVGLMMTQMTLDSDLIDTGLTWINVRVDVV